MLLEIRARDFVGGVEIQGPGPGLTSPPYIPALHAKNAQRLIEDRFHALWSNDDDAKYAVGRTVLDGNHSWLENLEREAPPSEEAAPATDERAAK